MKKTIKTTSYDEARAAVWLAYDKAIIAARRDYYEAGATAALALYKALAEIERKRGAVMSTQNDEMQAKKDAIRAAYNKAMATADRIHDKAMATAFRTYEKAMAEIERQEGR